MAMIGRIEVSWSTDTCIDPSVMASARPGYPRLVPLGERMDIDQPLTTPASHRRVSPPHPWLVPGLLFAAFLVVGICVDQGVFRQVDRWAYHHLRTHTFDWKWLADVAEIPVAAVLLALAAYKLRDRRREAVLWVAAFATSLVIELIGKALITRPHASPHSLAGTSLAQGSFPSGHVMRIVVVAGALTAAWPRLRWAWIALVVYVSCVVELTGMHTPSEVLGGVLGGCAIVTAVHAMLLQHDREDPPLDQAEADAAREPQAVHRGRDGEGSAAQRTARR